MSTNSMGETESSQLVMIFHNDGEYLQFSVELTSGERCKFTISVTATFRDLQRMIQAEDEAVDVKFISKDGERLSYTTEIRSLFGPASKSECYISINGNSYEMKMKIPAKGKADSDTMEDLFTIHGYSKPTKYGDAMLVIGLLLAKLNVDEGILSAVYCRSVLEEFKQNFLLNYLPARTKKTAEALREAYRKFYDDPVNAGSKHVRECLKINGTDFAENCLAMYKKASDLIHTVAQLYKKYRTLDVLRKLLQDLPKSGEMERAYLTAIVTLPSPSTAAVQGGPINFDTYYEN